MHYTMLFENTQMQSPFAAVIGHVNRVLFLSDLSAMYLRPWYCTSQI